MTISQTAGRSGAAERWFYAWMALACLTIAVLGFMPTYFLPLSRGAFQAPAVVHLHGLTFFAWTMLLCTQTWAVANGRTPAHREWGLLGIAIATAMAFTVMTVVIVRMHQFAASPYAGAVRAFTWVQVSGILFFEVVFALAIMNIRKPQIHKRLIMLGTISLLGAPIARWFLTLLAPPSSGPPQPPPVSVTVAPALVGDLLLLAAIIFDWRTRGRPHPVYLIGGAVMIALHLTMPIVAATPWWDAAAAAIARLGG